MKRWHCFLIVLVVLFSLNGCQKKHHITKPDLRANLTVQVRVRQLNEHYLGWTGITATISKTNFTQTLTMQADSVNASCVFNQLDPDVYDIIVRVDKNDSTLATGTGTITVAPANDTLPVDALTNLPSLLTTTPYGR